jgi:hypothetical protein
MRFAADVSTIGGGRPAFSVTTPSGGADSETGAIVFIVVVRRGAKKFLVATSLQPFLLSTDVVSNAAFFEVRAPSSLVCLFRLHTSWKLSSCIFGCPV